MLTLAAEPEGARGAGLHRPVVAFVAFLFPPRSRRRRGTPAARPLLPRAGLARRPVGVVGRSAARAPRAPRAQAHRRSQRPPGSSCPAARPGSRAQRRSGRAGGRARRREDGRQAADPDGQREAQQEHHAARQRRQDLEKCSRREGVRGTLAAGSLYFRRLWFCNFPDYSKYQDGHVKWLTLRCFHSPVNFNLNSFPMFDTLVKNNSVKHPASE